jgi:hypothetical protein
VASGEWRVTSWKKKQQQVPRCARNDNSRGVGALAMRWKKRKGKSRAPFAAQGEQGKQARPLEGLVGPRRKRVA